MVNGKESTVMESCRYDPYGRILESTAPREQDDSMEGDDPRKKITRYEYDPLGRLICQENPDQSTITNHYDDLNNQLTVTDQAGNSICYRYTTLGQISKIINKPKGETEGSVLTAYQYDYMLRPVNEITLDDQSIRAAKRYYYDNYDRVTATIVTGRTQNEILYDQGTLYQDVYDKKTARTVTVTAGDDHAANIVITTYKVSAGLLGGYQRPRTERPPDISGMEKI